MRGLIKTIILAVPIFLTSGCNFNDSINHTVYDSFVHVEIESSNLSSNEPNTWENRIGFGSGAIIKSDVTKTLILTAAHVCIPNFSRRIELLEQPDNITFITVRTWNNERYPVEIIGIDMINDLCLLQTYFTGLPALKLSRIPPIPGDKVYNLAAPYGIVGNKFVLTFSGIYSGTEIIDNEHVYTIPAGPGSSGSPVLNERGHIIGIIHSSTNVMETIAIGPTTESIVEFLSAF